MFRILSLALLTIGLLLAAACAQQRTDDERERIQLSQCRATSPQPAPLIPTRALASATVAIETDTAAYDAAILELRSGRLPKTDAIRAEEFAAAFTYAWPAPDPGEGIRLDLACAVSPWHSERRLLRIGLRARELAPAELPPQRIVLAVDVSDSVQALGLRSALHAALGVWASQLRPEDEVVLVVGADVAKQTWRGAPAGDAAGFAAALTRLPRGGGTDLGTLLTAAFSAARTGPDRAARVVLLSDGEVAPGARLPRRVEDLVWRETRAGIELLAVGLGRRAGVEALRELARAGNGACVVLVDPARLPARLEPARLVTVAREVKMQIRFDGEAVSHWRALGSGDRALATHEYADGYADGGELGGGEIATALYEYAPRAGAPPLRTAATIHLRWRDRDGREREQVRPLPPGALDLSELDADTRWAAAMHRWAECLRDPARADWRRTWSLALDGLGSDAEGERTRALDDVRRAWDLAMK